MYVFPRLVCCILIIATIFQLSAEKLTDCGPDYFLSEDDGCQPCRQACSVNRMERHNNTCIKLCPEFYSKLQKQRNEAQTDKGEHNQELAPYDNLHNIYIATGVSLVGVVAVLVVVILCATGKFPKCGRKNRMGPTTTDPIQETQEPLTAIKTEEDDIAFGNTSQLPPSNAQIYR